MIPTIKSTCFTPIPSPATLSTSQSSQEDNPFVVNEKSKQELLANSIQSLQKFSQSSSVNSLVNDLNLERKKAKFISKLGEILANLKHMKVENENDIQLIFKFVMQSAEDYLQHANKTKDMELKRDICIGLLKPFTANNEQLCFQVMKLVMPSVKPLTFWRKNKKLIRRGVLFFLSRGVSHSLN